MSCDSGVTSRMPHSAGAGEVAYKVGCVWPHMGVLCTRVPLHGRAVVRVCAHPQERPNERARKCAGVWPRARVIEWLGG